MHSRQDSSENPDLETGLTPDEIEELLSLLQTPVSPNSGSEGSNQGENIIIDKRKRRRMISNRESARRSRWRKKRHLENLVSQVNRLRVENQELKTQLGLILNQCYVAWRQNEQLIAEDLILRGRLSDLYRILVAMQAQEVNKYA